MGEIEEKTGSGIVCVGGVVVAEEKTEKTDGGMKHRESKYLKECLVNRLKRVG